MGNQKIVVRIGLTRRVTDEFEKEVNKLLAEGMHLEGLSVTKSGLRILCVAVLCNQAEISTT